MYTGGYERVLPISVEQLTGNVRSFMGYNTGEELVS